MATTTPFLNWSNTNCQMCARRTCTFPQKPHLLFVVGRTAHSRSLCFWKIACFCIGQCQKLATLARTSWLSSKIGFDNFLVVFPLKISKSPPSSSFQKETMLAERISAQIRILFLLFSIRKSSQYLPFVYLWSC